MKRFSPKLPLGVTEERFLQRLFVLTQIFDGLSRWLPGARLDERILRHALICYYSDLERMKVFHGITHADQHKRAAFLMVWISRTHPVQIVPDSPMRSNLVVANEVYALHAGINHLLLDIKSVSMDYLRNLLYILHFRPISGEVLASSMYLLECASTGKRP